MDTIGFIGVGNMGSAILKGIAGSSLKQETSLFAYNPTEAKVDALANCGVQKCGSAAEVVERAGTCSWRSSRRSLKRYCRRSQMQ